MRSTQTVVIAHVSPCATDVSHSINTLRYAVPLKVREGGREGEGERGRGGEGEQEGYGEEKGG